MKQKDYSSPELTIISIGHMDVITASNYEMKDVLVDDSYDVWYE